MENENTLSDTDLKILGYKQRIAELVTEYEDKIMDLRVALTRAQEQINEMGQAFMQNQAEQASAEVDYDEVDIVDGDVVEDNGQE